MRRIFVLTLLLSAFTLANARAELRGKILIKGQNIPVSRALILFSSGTGKGTAQPWPMAPTMSPTCRMAPMT